MQNKISSCCVLALCAALFFGGCASVPESRSVIMAAPPQNSGVVPSLAADAVNAPAAQDVPMALSTLTTALSGAYTGGESSAYTTASYADGSADILRFDYGARTMSILELPEKTDDNFQGRITGTWGGITPRLLGDDLFLFHLGGSTSLMTTNGETAAACIMRTDAFGGNLVRLSFPAGLTFSLSSAILSDDAFLYFLMLDEGDNSTVLLKADLALTSYEEIYRYQPGYEYTIDGYWEKGPLIVAASPLPALSDPEFNTYWENREFKLLAQGMNTGVQQELLVWLQGQSYSTQGSVHYYWNNKDATLCALDANTGQESVLASGFAPDDYVQAQLMRTVLDGKLRLQFSTNRYTRDYYIDASTGEVKETPIDKLGDTVTVCAQSSAGFLIRYGEHWVAAAKIPAGLVGTEVSPTNPNWIKMPEYALIDPASYWAGTQNFTSITDLVYG